MQQRSKEKELFRASGIWFNIMKQKLPVPISVLILVHLIQRLGVF